MTLQVIGAGLGRTGTYSLKLALEQLLGGPCYHMRDVFARPQDVSIWHEALLGRAPRWKQFLSGYAAAVDEPPSYFWRELAEEFPDALVLLSTRESQGWYRSMNRTILDVIRRGPPPEMDAWYAMVLDMFDLQFPEGWDNPVPTIAAYERRNAAVRAEVPPERLIDWRLGDNWDPLCSALGVAVPNEPFPVTNTTAEFRDRAGLEDANG